MGLNKRGSSVWFYFTCHYKASLYPLSAFQTQKKGFPGSAVLIPGVQPASPSYHIREKSSKRAMINERRSPLPWIHLQELLYWSCGEAAAQSNSAAANTEKESKFCSQALIYSSHLHKAVLYFDCYTYVAVGVFLHSEHWT